MARQTLRVGDWEVAVHHVRWVEAELRRHHWRKQRLRVLEEGIIRATSPVEPGMPRSSGPGNPTFSRAMALMNDQEAAHLRMMIRTVEDVYRDLTPLQQDIVRMLYYEKRHTMEGVAFHLERDRVTIWRQRNMALIPFVITLIGDHAVSNATKPQHRERQ